MSSLGSQIILLSKRTSSGCKSFRKCAISFNIYICSANDFSESSVQFSPLSADVDSPGPSFGMKTQTR
jgi:hypothetical protein